MTKKSLTIGFIAALAAVPALAAYEESMIRGTGIMVFTGSDYRGSHTTIRNDIDNLATTGFNDKITSVRVAPGEEWQLCEHENYKGRCVTVSGQEPDLRGTGWNERISSLRRVRSGSTSGRPYPPSGGTPYLTLYDQTSYRGASRDYSDSVSNIQGQRRRARSVKIDGGAWELCEGKNFTGRCVTIDRSVPDLASQDLRYRVASVRPVSRTGRYPSGDEPYIVLFDETSYRGRSRNYEQAVRDLGGASERAESATINAGIWQLCDGPDFTGQCVTLRQSTPDLGPLRNRVTSLRLVSQRARR